LGTGNEFEFLKPDTRSGNNDELKQSISELMATGLSNYAIAKKLLPDGGNSESFKVKVNRIASKIRDEENNGNK
jgi:hypothetical protein